MLVAVLDAGFQNVDKLSLFSELDIAGTYDFVYHEESVFEDNSHGRNVLAALAGYSPGNLIGGAYKATFYLFKTEDTRSESPLEEAYWVIGVERADSLGVDVIQTSLGYNTFDKSEYDYEHSDLDGKTALISQGANWAAETGMLVVTSAGNEGNNSWQKITTPADSEKVLTVGAVDRNENYASFSSLGYNANGTVKPDLMAMGQSAVVWSNSDTPTTGNGTSYSAPILCGLATLFVQPLIYAYEKLFGLVSDVSLLELSDTNTKLLKELANKAPGTFHHSLNVANLAEASANEIGANAMLVRVGALYHDIGKMKNPTFFTENQATGINPHDELSPKESAAIIINHVIDGIEMAKKYNLPDRVIDFIRTHHGTSLVYYFYSKEKGSDGGININDFRYPGPSPFSKETAILMMCDSVEAASKSLKEPTSAKIEVFVENIISKQIENGQFLNANITFKEIQSIKKVLKHKLANIYHLRIEYPE